MSNVPFVTFRVPIIYHFFFPVILLECLVEKSLYSAVPWAMLSSETYSNANLCISYNNSQGEKHTTVRPCFLLCGNCSPEKEVRNVPRLQLYCRVVSSFLKDIRAPFTPSLVKNCVGFALPPCQPIAWAQVLLWDIHVPSCALSSAQHDLSCPAGALVFQRILVTLCPPLNCSWAT